MAELAKEVYTVELVEPLAQKAKAVLDSLGYRNIRFRVGDGWKGWPVHAPYDKIVVTAAPPEIPKALVDQLKEGGRMILPVGTLNQQLTLGVKKNGNFQTIETIPVRFVPLVQTKTEKEEQP